VSGQGERERERESGRVFGTDSVQMDIGTRKIENR